MKREYASKNFDLDYLKKVDLQQVGGYISIHDSGLTEKGMKELSMGDESEFSTISYTDSQDDKYVADYTQLDYNSYEWFEDEWQEFVGSLMNNKYNHYIVMLKSSKWNGASGLATFDNYYKCFMRDYDCSMYYSNSSAKGKVLELTEYSHDIPTGHNTVIVGLTDTEYERLDNMGLEEQFKFARKFITE